MKKITVLALGLVVSGCSVVELTETVDAIKTAVCSTTTPESRAEIRDGQKIKTDICGDLK